MTLERRVNFSASLRDVVALDADVFADVNVLRKQPDFLPLTQCRQYATGAGCDDEGRLMKGFSGRKVQQIHTPKLFVVAAGADALSQLDVTGVQPFLFEQARCSRPRSHFEMWEITHDRLA